MSIRGANSSLTARNGPILAHGFDRVAKPVFDQLWQAALELAQVSLDELPLFPRLADGPPGNRD